jgi:hypothetical protein
VPTATGSLPYRVAEIRHVPARSRPARFAWAVVDLMALVLLGVGTWRALPWEPCELSLEPKAEALPASHAH